MRNTLFLLLCFSVASGCSDAEVKGVGPGGIGDASDASGDVIADAGNVDSGIRPDGGEVSDADTSSADVAPADGGGVSEDASVDSGPQDTGAIADVGPVDAGLDIVSDVGAAGDTFDTQVPDVPLIPEDVEDPGLCEVDEDCILLTPKSCCPVEPNPCGATPEGGTEQEQGEILAWIAQSCDPSEECTEYPAPECETCHMVVTYKPICDFETKKCAVLEVPDCNALCEAFAQPTGQTCPLVSNPELVTAEGVDDCGGCAP